MELSRPEVDRLIVEHSPQVFRILHRFCGNIDFAQDLLQDSVEKALRMYPSVRNPVLFKEWFIVVALNHARNRSKRARKEIPIYDLPEMVDGKMGPDELVLQLLTIKKITELAQSLPTRQYQAFRLRFFKDLSFKEIADQMGCEYDTAKANYLHAVTKIKRAYFEAVAK